MNIKLYIRYYAFLLIIPCLFTSLSCNQNPGYTGILDDSNVSLNEAAKTEEPSTINNPDQEHNIDEDAISTLYYRSKKDRDTYEEAANLLRLGNLNSERPNSLSKASKDLAYLQTAVAISKNKGYTDIQLKSYSKMCSIYTTNKMYNQALIYANLFLDTCKDAKNIDCMAEGYMMVGRILREENKIDQADSIFNLSLASITPKTYVKTQGFLYLHIARLSYMKAEFDKSLEYANIGLDFINKNEEIFSNSSLRSWLRAEILRNYIQKRQFDDAYTELSFFEQKMKDEGHGREYFYYLASIQDAQGKGDEAIANYIKAAEIFNQNKNYYPVIDISMSIFSLLQKQGEVSEEFAETYLSAFSAAKSISNKNNINSLFRKISFDLEQERLNYLILEDQLEGSRKITLLTIGILILSMMAFSLLWFFYQNQKLNTIRIEQLNKTLSSTNSKLIENNQSLENFALVAAHEFKRPILSVAEKISHIKELALSGKLTDIDSSLNQIIYKLIGLNEVIDELLNSTKKSEEIPMPMNINLNNIMLSMKNSIQSHVQHENIKLIMKKDFPMVLGHTSLVNRLIMNIVNSSVELFKNEGDTVIEIDWETAEGYMIEIIIKSNDVILSEKESKEAFNTLKSEIPSNRVANTGLGLITSRKIVEMYKGKIWIDNTPPKGSSIHFTLPASRLVKITT